jgi:PAS domain S-box-containing protein
MTRQLIDSLNFNILIVEIPRHASPTVDTATIRHLNGAAAALLGYAADEIINKPISLIVAAEYHSSLSRWLDWEPGGLRANTLFECLLLDRQGRPLSVLLSRSPFSGVNARNDEFALLIQDITESRQQRETLQIMHRAVEQSASAVVITDPKGHIEYVNPKFMQLTEFSIQELLGQNLRILQSGMTSKEHYRQMWNALLDIGEWRGEIENRKKNGEHFWAYESISAIKNQRGEITHFLSIAEDISLRKHAESALLESEERFRQMAEMAGEWLWEQNAEGYYIYSSTAVKKILGFNPEEVVGKHYTEFLTAQDKESLKPNADIQQPFYALTNHYRHRDGHLVITESTGLPIKNAAGQLLKWRGVDRDITARKHFQDALIDSEKRKRLIFETALSAIIIMDSYGIVSDWNPRAEKMFGWRPEEAIGQPLADLIIPLRFRADHRQGLKHFLHTGQGKILNKLTEHTAIRRDGSEFPVEFSVSPLQVGHVYEFSGFIHDITERKRLEHRFRQAVESSPNAIIMVNESGTIVMVNAQTETSFGYSRTELIGQPVEILVPERFRSAHIGFRHAYLAAPVSRSMGVGRDLYGLRKDGTEFPVEIGLSLIDSHEETLVLSTIVDITTRKETEQRIRQAQVDLAIAHNEIKIAQQIQSSLFPAAPLSAEHFEITGFCLPADRVGGDYYDYFHRDREHVDMVVADVSGHSVGPALFMAETRSALHTQANWPGTPAQTLTVLNRLLFDDLDRADYFITLSYLQYNTVTGQMLYANAGHPPPLLLRSDDGHCVQLDADGLILGVRKQIEFQERSVTLAPGDTILIYTDGLVEAENAQGEFFGMERAAGHFKNHAHLPPQEIIAAILTELRQFCRKDSFADDITLLIFKRR